MAVTVKIEMDEAGRMTPYYEGQPLAEATLLAGLPSLEQLQADPFAQGRPLAQALGGAALVQLLEADPDRLLLLAAEGAADEIPWEFAALPGSQLLACAYGMLRLVERETAAAPAQNGPLQFVALGADPLVDSEGRARDGYRLDIHNEMQAIRRTLLDSGVAMVAQRVPPTREALRRALRRGPAVLHLTCHGDVVETKEYGTQALLLLEDENGGADALMGRDLVVMPTAGVVRLVVLSACHSAKGGDARLARAMVMSGVPAAIGMQAAFSDLLSDEFAVALYEMALAGYSIGEALRQARQALLAKHYGQAGLPAGYVSRSGWGALPLQPGTPTVGGLGLPGRPALPQEVRPPRPLLGRNRELHELAALYGQGAKVVTVVGTGGMGKTALAAAFAERFAWRWREGVLAVSFAGGEPDAARFRADLIRGLGGEAAVQRLAEATAAQQAAAILDALRDWDGLLLLDNYETILQELREERGGKSEEKGAKSAAREEGSEARGEAAREIHRLVAQAAEGGARLLLTSREQPAGLSGEVLFPGGRQALAGVAAEAGAELFVRHSSRAKQATLWEEKQAQWQLALDIARATEGHPLAIALLAGEYDVSEVAAADFLANWDEELAAARREGLAAHHVTFRVAFERSYERLPGRLQERLKALAVFPFPFYAEGAALVWGLTTSKEDVVQAREELGRLVRASLLEVDGWFEDNTPSAYRFQPALYREVRGRAEPQEIEGRQTGYAAYGAWLASSGYGAIHREPALAHRVRLSMDALEAATATLDGPERLWHIWRLAWLKRAYGEIQAAYDLLRAAVPADPPLPDTEAEPELAGVHSKLQHELANILVVRGDLEGAMALYRQSLQIQEQLGDIQGKAATLSQLANLYMQQGDWAAAEEAIQQSLVIAEQLSQQDAIAFNKVKLGQVAAAQGDPATALAGYREGLAIFERLGMPRETEQMQQMIWQLERGEGGPADPLAQAVQRARAAAQQGNAAAAIQAQEEAVELIRQFGQEPEVLVQLSILLYNLAGYYQQAGQYEAGVKALEEVVALDEQTGHPDLESDQAALEQARQWAGMSPEERAQLLEERGTQRNSEELGGTQEGDLSAALAEQLANLPPEQRAQLEAVMRQLAQASPEELAALQTAAVRQQIEDLANQTREAALAALRGEIEAAALAQRMEEVAAKVAEGEETGSPWAEVAAFVQAVAAVLRGEAAPAVPAAYAGPMAAILAAKGGGSG